MKKISPIILLVILIIAAYTSVYFYKKASTLKANPNAVAQKEAADLVAKVGTLIVLPEGEIPTIATVSDPEKLKGQAFFTKAKEGDKILFYQSVQKAYLYDPVAHKILEIAAINLGAQKTVQKVEVVEESEETTEENN